MSARAVIDSLEFARSGGEMRGEVQVAELGRLADSLYDHSGNLRYALVGQTDGHQRPRLRLAVNGTISLKCQRCLGNLPYQVAMDSSLLVLGETADSATSVEIDELDAVAADSAMDVWSLVEDEVLLALPIAPRHPEGECLAGIGLGRDRAASPFAALAGLKQKQVKRN
jgi:uncharacterized protein